MRASITFATSRERLSTGQLQAIAEMLAKPRLLRMIRIETAYCCSRGDATEQFARLCGNQRIPACKPPNDHRTAIALSHAMILALEDEGLPAEASSTRPCTRAAAL